MFLNMPIFIANFTTNFSNGLLVVSYDVVGNIMLLATLYKRVEA